jgi:hypothetical protein
MNPETPRRDDEVEALVRDYFRAEERTVDARRTLAGVRSKRSARTWHALGALSSRAIPATSRWAAGVAAAALLFGLISSFRQGSAHADAVELVREARHVLRQTRDDRTYQVRIDLAPGIAEKAPVLAALATFECRLWTRSDRFWVEGRRSGDVWACGRDEGRHLWVASPAGIGLDFAPKEAPESLDEALDLFSFDIDTVLHLLSTEYDVMAIDDGFGGTSGVTRIRGTPKAGHPRPRMRSVTVEIDERTKLIRRVILSRILDGRPAAEVYFTFDRFGTQLDSAYQVWGHVGTDAPVFGPDQPSRRRHELAQFFGSLLLNGE